MKDLHEWNKHGYYKTDVLQRLFDECPDQIDRVHISQLSQADFCKKYEKTNKPVIIRGVTDDWNVPKYWTFDVSSSRCL